MKLPPLPKLLKMLKDADIFEFQHGETRIVRGPGPLRVETVAPLAPVAPEPSGIPERVLDPDGDIAIALGERKPPDETGSEVS